MICSSRKRSSAPISSSPRDSCAGVVAVHRFLHDAIGQRHLVGRLGVELLAGEIEREQLPERREEPVEVPVLEEVPGRVLLDGALDHGGDFAAGLLAQALAFEHLVAVGVDHPPLLVHHVVVLEHLFTGQEVLFLDLALGFLDLFGEHPGLDRFLVALLVDAPEAVEDLVDPLAGEQPHQVVLGRQEEARLARVALAPGAAAQLVVDAPRLVALGAADEQPAGGEHLLAGLLELGFDVGQDLEHPLLALERVLGFEAFAGHLLARQVLGVAAELDVDAAAGHVGGDRDRARRPASATISASRAACSGLAFSTVCGIPRLLQPLAEQLGDLDRDRPHEHRLAVLVAGRDLVQDRVPLAVLGLVDLVVAVVADHRPVGRDLDDRELVDLHELGRLGQRRAGHARELVVQAEVVLVGDRRERLVLLLDRHALLGLDRLVQALRPAPALEDPAGELVDDLDLAVDHRVVDVALVQRLRLQRLDQVVDEVAVLGPVQVVDAEEALGLGDALLGDRDRLVLLVELVVEVGDELLLASAGPCLRASCRASSAAPAGRT